MSILIKGMRIPKNCCECPLETDYGTCGYYSLFVEGGHDSDWEKRRDDCPLIELPSHGDLIDIGALNDAMYHEAFETDSDMQKWDSGCWVRYKMFEKHRDLAPVIIPAERG